MIWWAGPKGIYSLKLEREPHVSETLSVPLWSPAKLNSKRLWANDLGWVRLSSGKFRTLDVARAAPAVTGLVSTEVRKNSDHSGKQKLRWWKQKLSWLPTMWHTLSETFPILPRSTADPKKVFKVSSKDQHENQLTSLLWTFRKKDPKVGEGEGEETEKGGTQREAINLY